MKKINYLKGLLLFFIPFLLLLFIVTLLYYFDILNNQIIKYFKFFTILFSSIISGIFIGKKSLNKGYLNGILLGISISLIFLITNLLFKEFRWYQLIYYLIIVITTCIGSMIGINKK